MIKHSGLQNRFLSISLVCTVCMSFVPSVWAQAYDQNRDNFEIDYRNWKEDPERVQRYWKTGQTADAYARSIRLTGQKNMKENLRGSLGPWSPTGPTGDFAGAPYNGRASGIEILRGSGGTYDVYVGACGGGLWKCNSADGVGVWTSLGDNLPNPSVRAFSVSPDDSDTIIVGTGDWSRYGGGGLFKTTDGGNTWIQPVLRNSWGNPVNPSACFRVIRIPGNPNTVFLACSEGVYRSTDGGNTWILVLTGEATDLVIHPTDSNSFYACIKRDRIGLTSGVYTSADGGNSWGRLGSPVLPTNADWTRASIAICRNLPDNLALVVENGNYPTGVYKTTDGGATWIDISGDYMNEVASNQIAHAQAIAINPSDPQKIYLGSVGLAETVDGGSSWTVEFDGNIIGHADFTQLYFSSVTGNSVLWMCNDGGVYRRVSGGNAESWNGNSSTGLRTSQIDFMDAQRQYRVIGLQDNGVVYRPNAVSDWISHAAGDGFGVRIVDPGTPEFWFCNGVYGPPSHRVFKVSGPNMDNEFTNNTGSDIYEFFYDFYSEKMFIAEDQRLVSTPVYGPLAGWDEENVNLPLYGVGCKEAFGSRLESETLYISYWTNGRDVPRLSTVRKTGGSWNIHNTSFGTAGSGDVQVVYASTENPGESWAGILGDVGLRFVHTTDYWQTWEDLTNELSSVGRVEAIAVSPFNQDQIFVGTDIGVFWSEDGGNSWDSFQSGLPVVRVTDLRYMIHQNAGETDRLVVATYGRGMYERPISGPAINYVDGNSTAGSDEDGSLEKPYNTLNEGLYYSPDGGIVALRGGSYANSGSALTIDEPVTLNSYVGSAVIGD